ncbi:MAG: S-formylglutathione hydrolase [Alphaproteobacteria bacterium]|nr:S-formylglutathione hydrolase [Alphaproteobacteria bacterium]
MELVSEQKCFGGVQGVYRHASAATGTDMQFAVYRPPQAERGPVPVLWWLSGLTCTEDNFTVKAGAQRSAAERGVMLVMPDTSPRGDGVPDDDAYDFGQGAGFYVDATEAPWSGHFKMYSYVTEDLPALIFDRFPGDRARQGIFGHSMGGHGALTIALRHPGTYRSVSAFAPISAPTQCPWGRKAFTGYFGGHDGDRRERARGHDAVALIEDGARFDATILVDQGDADPFLDEQLRPELLRAACAAAAQPLTYRLQPGYDHSYFFIATFIADHIVHHAEMLCD